MEVKEAYVSQKTLELLKEKGFRYSGFKYIDFEGEIIEQTTPTLQLVMRWLREVHRFIFIIYHDIEYGKLQFSWRVYQLQPDMQSYVDNLKGVCNYYVDGKKHYYTYEGCCEGGIRYCLKNLI